MKLDEYAKLYPNERVWRTGHKVIEEGMLQFDEETAGHFAGPFEGNFAYYRLEDARNHVSPKYPLLTQEVVHQRFRFSAAPFTYSAPAKSEEHLQKRLARFSPKELREWQLHQDKHNIIEQPTVETPFMLFLGGNDDISYTKYYPTLELAREDLELFLLDQPLNYWTHVADYGFVFTN